MITLVDRGVLTFTPKVQTVIFLMFAAADLTNTTDIKAGWAASPSITTKHRPWKMSFRNATKGMAEGLAPIEIEAELWIGL